MSDSLPNGLSSNSLVVVESCPHLIPSIGPMALFFAQESIPSVGMILLVVLLNCWEAIPSSEADVLCGAGVILLQANLNQMKAWMSNDHVTTISHPAFNCIVPANTGV